MIQEFRDINSALKEQAMSGILLRRLLTYAYPNGDFSHRPNCYYTDTLVLNDCSCGLRELNHDIMKWAEAQEENDG